MLIIRFPVASVFTASFINDTLVCAIDNSAIDNCNIMQSPKPF